MTTVPEQPEDITNAHVLSFDLNQSPLCILHIVLTVFSPSSWSTLARSGPLAVRSNSWRLELLIFLILKWFLYVLGVDTQG